MSPIIGLIFLIIWLVKVINKTFPEVDSNNEEVKVPVFEKFSNNNLNETIERSVYLHQYYVNQEPILGNHHNYYLNYLGDLSNEELSIPILKKAYKNTIVYPHKSKATAKAAAKYLKDRAIYLSMN